MRMGSPTIVVTPSPPRAAPAKEPRKPAPADPPAPTPVKESPLLTALRLVLEKHPNEARRLLEKYDKPDRDQLLALLRLTADVSSGDLPPGEAEELLEQLHHLTCHLSCCAPLTLGKVCFCRKIESFGQYHAVDGGPEFQAGCEGRPGERVQVYAEVRNFSSRLHKGQYETLLTSSLEIYDGHCPPGGKCRPVVTMNLGTCIDRSQTARQDYFLNFQFHVPARLPPGLYTLRVTVAKGLDSDWRRSDLDSGGQALARLQGVPAATPAGDAVIGASQNTNPKPPGATLICPDSSAGAGARPPGTPGRQQLPCPSSTLSRTSRSHGTGRRGRLLPCPR